MQVQHGRLSVDVPADWMDRSTLLFVGPPPAAPTVAATRVAQPSLSVTFARAPKGEPRGAARAVLDDELEGLRAMNVGLEVLGFEDFTCAFGSGVASVHKVSLDGVTLRQIHAVAIQGPLAVRAVAACGEADFAMLEHTMRGALASIALASGARA